MNACHANLALRFTLVFGVMLGSVAASAGLFAPPQDGAPVLVVAAPWSGGPAQIIAQIGGQEIAPGRAPFGALAILDDPSLARDAGAWAVLDGRVIARLCGAQVEGAEHV